MDLYYKQEVTVGVLVMIAALIFVVGLMWLSGLPLFGGGGRTTVDVWFDNVSGLSEGDPVQVSGFNVGRVAEVTLESEGRVLVTLEISDDLRPRADASAKVGALDFLGSKFVDYSPGSSSTMLPEGSTVAGTLEAGITDALPGLTDQAGNVLLGLETFLTEETATTFRKTLAAAERALVSFETIGDGPAMREATRALTRLGNAAASLDSVLANPSIQESVNQLDEVMTSLQEMAEGLGGATTALSAILERIDAGEGSLGKALVDSTLHDDLHEVFTSLQRLLDDMRERPGRYFRLKVF